MFSWSWKPFQGISPIRISAALIQPYISQQTTSCEAHGNHQIMGSSCLFLFLNFLYTYRTSITAQIRGPWQFRCRLTSRTRKTTRIYQAAPLFSSNPLDPLPDTTWARSIPAATIMPCKVCGYMFGLSKFGQRSSKLGRLSWFRRSLMHPASPSWPTPEPFITADRILRNFAPLRVSEYVRDLLVLTWNIGECNVWFAIM
jgi:hypothetical protein